VAIAPSGEVMVAWITPAGPNDSRVPVVTWRTPGSGWAGPLAIGPPETLEPYLDHPFHATPPFAPRLRFGGDGRAVLTWNRRAGRGSSHTLQWATRPAGGVWTDPAAVFPEPTYGSTFWAGLTRAPAGAAALLWKEGAGYEWTAAGANGLGPIEPTPIPALYDLIGVPDLAVDGRGASVAVFGTNPPQPVVSATARAASGGWSPPTALSSFAAPSADAPAQPPACAAGPARRAVVARPVSHRETSAAQLLAANRRIAQAAIRRAAAVTALLNRGLGPEHLRDGAFCAAAFAGEVWTAGGGTDGGVRAGKRAPMPAITGGRVKVEQVSAARLRADALLVQTAMRRANALVARLDAGLTGRDIRDGAIGPAELAKGLEIDGAVTGGATPARRAIIRPARSARPAPGRLVANQRIAAEALRRIDAVRERIAEGLTGADFRPGSIGLSDLRPSLRD
jgi:hypothetical protein